MVKLKKMERSLLGTPCGHTSDGKHSPITSVHLLTATGQQIDKTCDRSGGMLVTSGGLVSFQSRKQLAIALSSWEGELHAAVTIGVGASDAERTERHGQRPESPSRT